MNTYKQFLIEIPRSPTIHINLKKHVGVVKKKKKLIDLKCSSCDLIMKFNVQTWLIKHYRIWLQDSGKDAWLSHAVTKSTVSQLLISFHHQHWPLTWGHETKKTEPGILDRAKSGFQSADPQPHLTLCCSHLIVSAVSWRFFCVGVLTLERWQAREQQERRDKDEKVQYGLWRFGSIPGSVAAGTLAETIVLWAAVLLGQCLLWVLGHEKLFCCRSGGIAACRGVG